ncbi:MAG: nuclear transport factor 2 family protein [bacterium]
MYFSLLLAVAITVAAPSGTARQPAQKAQPQTQQSVLDAENDLCKGYESNDAAAVKRGLADDYTLTDSKGVITTKQDDIDDFVKHRVTYTTFRNKNMKVRLYPGVAIVTGQTVVKGTAGSAKIDIEVQFTDTLVFQNGRWMLAAGHVSRLKS